MSYLIFGLLFCQAFVYTRAHRDCTETCDRRCYDLFKKSDANSFLGNGRLSTSRDCCLEFPNCESKGTANSCFTEQYRQYIVDTADQSQKHSCSPGQILTVNSWCPGHRRDGALICSEPCTALGVGVNRCFNGGNCVSNGASYYCVCAPGFTGPICYDEINECLSNPCQNGATCHDHINEFRCECPPGKYGLLCDTGICQPTPADFVFVLDSSISMTKTQFQKQLEFVASFANKVRIGVNDSQISVITFSTEAFVEFYLNQYRDNISIIDAVMNITFRPGTTRTDKGLRAVKTVFTVEHGADRQFNGTREKAGKYVYLLTDGMSKYRAETRQAAQELKSDPANIQIAVIGIGDEVSHEELLDIASVPEFVYSVINFNSLYTVLSRLVHVTCKECEHRKESDVALFIDSSSDKLDSFRDAVSHLINITNHLGDDGTHFGLTIFSSSIQDILDMGTFDKSVINMKLNSFSKQETTKIVAMENVLEHARTNVFTKSTARANAKKLLLVFSNGDSKVLNQTAFKQEQFLLKSMDVHIYAVASMADDDRGSDLDLPCLYDLVTDPYNVFIISTIDKDSHSSLDVLQNEFVFDICNLNETRH